MFKNSLYELKRTKEIIFVLAKYGFGDIIESLGIPVPFKETPKLSRSERIRKAIEELGPTFIKLAQLLSLRPDLVPLDLAKEFEKLQDSVTPLPFEEMKRVLEDEFEKPYTEIFEEDFELLASASIGQVYKARLKTGEIVAVKILKPDIEEKIYADIAILQRLAKLLRDRFLIYGVDLEKIVEEFAKSIKKELDFNIEALNLKRFANNFRNNSDIKVPKLYEKYSSKRVLTMEFIEGIKISDIDALKKAGYDLKEITKKGFDLICEQIFIHRFFHADPHPGNLMVSNGKIVFLDFGIMGRLSDEDRQYFVEMIYYVIKQQEEKAALYVLKLSKVQGEIDISSFKKEMADIISSYFYSSLKQVELRALIEDMLKVMQRYKIYFKEDNYLLAKALVTMEGIGKKLYPEFNAAEEIKPFIIKIYKQTISPFNILKRSHEINKAVMEFITQAPSDLNEIIGKLKRGELKVEFEHVGLEEFEEAIEKSFNRLSTSIIIASLLIGSSMLLSSHIPPLFKNISLFGIIGFIFASILGVILIFTVLRKK
ncbi:ABC1 kinase family protein [Caminibacter pacificus]|uniref:AarF/ABC1/UbiB kinase family protein n=1 Tax=Caminibacter pacificus TaxID=1424653 RepID=A0AAJ4UYA6_9BACT|nr:AarF/ABC1/UbiB kinase family protein [Caminibacter pacificus]QCI28557.1 AarF/ABC1/UbiB kinase family protein [Caminibacter pacificus]ROR40716.1 ubiquinone biosynthesis protein [Caminibacter pacificus]